MTKDKSILIRNIYYMLSYAFTTLNQGGYENVETEEFENDEISEEIEEIIEEDTELRGNDATIEALEFYYPPDNND